MIGSKPIESELKFLENLQLIQVAVGEFEFQLNFYEDVGISIECEVTINQERCGGIEAAKKLLTQLGKKIKRLKVLPSFDLEILFSTGLALLLHLRSDGNESYNITKSTEWFV